MESQLKEGVPLLAHYFLKADDGIIPDDYRVFLRTCRSFFLLILRSGEFLYVVLELLIAGGGLTDQRLNLATNERMVSTVPGQRLELLAVRFFQTACKGCDFCCRVRQPNDIEDDLTVAFDLVGLAFLQKLLLFLHRRVHGPHMFEHVLRHILEFLQHAGLPLDHWMFGHRIRNDLVSW